MYTAAIFSSIGAWFIGLFIDANIDFGDPVGFLSTRILFPIIVMGLFILKAVNTRNKE